jgi:uncharacterized protein YndB with AHSA1/START domain
MSEIINHPPAASKGICELEIKADPATVWRAMVEETGQWWLKDYYTREGAEFRIEAKLGGRMFEDQGSGNGLLWGNIIGVDPEKSLDIQGYLLQSFGGPALTYIAIRLEPGDGVTKFTLTNTIFGFPSPKSAESMDAGWLQLFEEGLKAYVEGKA